MKTSVRYRCARCGVLEEVEVSVDDAEAKASGNAQVFLGKRAIAAQKAITDEHRDKCQPRQEP